MILADIKGIGPKTLKTLENNNINTIDNLVEYYPYTFKEFKYSTSLDEDKVIIKALVESIPMVNYFKKRLNKMTFKVSALNRLMNVSIFNRAFLKNNIKVGNEITIVGKYDTKTNNFVASDIMFQILPPNGIIKPLYHPIGDLTSTKIHNYINLALEDANNIEYVPAYLKEKYHLINKDIALKEIHNPHNVNTLKQAMNYLKYEEMFLFMLKMNYLKNNKDKNVGIKRTIDRKKIDDFIKKLPFVLTDSQLECIEDIYNDLTCERRMNRLLQGDVSSGKTIVAIISLYINYLSGYQGVFMAPTEILASQHYDSVLKFLDGLGIKVALLTGSLKAKERKEMLTDLENNKIDILIGTHALFSKDVTYNNLGLVITDEQHRFGVNQRSSLNNKGINPDILYLSATPIPRTYAIILYGDMDISSIRVMPRAKRKIETTLTNSKNIKVVLDTIYQELKDKHQVYIVAPLIDDEDDTSDSVINLKDKFEKAFSKVAKIDILHGKMTTEEKDKVMREFKEHKIDILISTTVIEVGVDVANATTMVIFDAYRFGLSQLHQLRGRIGRNELNNYCILISDKETERLKILTETDDGFKISEEDFRLRGAGDIFGLRQSGQIGFNLADETRDFNILLRANEDAARFINDESSRNDYKFLWEIIENSMNLN
ncbi:MAG: ATP-dependent DNA helicase RecG [Bacilli bacterium]|nr:ATP-dependent DNA helicase RecG [Bacilli bacterium]